MNIEQLIAIIQAVIDDADFDRSKYRLVASKRPDASYVDVIADTKFPVNVRGERATNLMRIDLVEVNNEQHPRQYMEFVVSNVIRGLEYHVEHMVT